ncbi:hypothetical protein DYI24_06280 [Rhodopseudomonas sp. BR0C11]|uniref:hypothetical protein n=1 Tax=Rhodopseudomonas sp. BR0C11 TaxID=2269370 RepID=UPI0013DFB243|nr:hypothetical protein [Rhodopseudomonas sp. BR0C11]NEV76648.1 hypothetical protein [Rhodopseudomonas sp. BR0C11]
MEEELFRAVGYALTHWEGLEAELGGVYAVLTAVSEERYVAPTIRAFGVVTNTNSRAEMIAHAAEALFWLRPMEELEIELKDILKNYRGWAARRNDIAHGCSTASQHPDYDAEDQPNITTYCLCPSHGHSRKWALSMEPLYHYIPAEIEAFGSAFDALAHRVADFSERLEAWRKKDAEKDD